MAIAPTLGESVGRANETDTALPLSRFTGTGTAVETDINSFPALPVLDSAGNPVLDASGNQIYTRNLNPGLAMGHGFASETDSAFRLGFSLPVGLAIETDSPFNLGLSLRVTPANENDIGATAAIYDRDGNPVLDRDAFQIYLRGIQPLVVIGAGRANETDVALGLNFAYSPGAANENDTAFSPAFGVSAGRANETDVALALRIGIRVGRADEVDIAARLKRADSGSITPARFVGSFLKDFAA
jgi:hypothetical protein